MTSRHCGGLRGDGLHGRHMRDRQGQKYPCLVLMARVMQEGQSMTIDAMRRVTANFPQAGTRSAQSARVDGKWYSMANEEDLWWFPRKFICCSSSFLGYSVPATCMIQTPPDIFACWFWTLMASSSGYIVPGEDPFQLIEIELRELRGKSQEQRCTLHHVDAVTRRRFKRAEVDIRQLRHEFTNTATHLEQEKRDQYAELEQRV